MQITGPFKIRPLPRPLKCDLRWTGQQGTSHVPPLSLTGFVIDQVFNNRIHEYRTSSQPTDSATTALLSVLRINDIYWPIQHLRMLVYLWSLFGRNQSGNYEPPHKHDYRRRIKIPINTPKPCGTLKPSCPGSENQ